MPKFEKRENPVGVEKENNIDQGLREEIDRDLNVAGTGEQPNVGGNPNELLIRAGIPLDELLANEPRLGSKENPLQDLTAETEKEVVRPVYLDIPLPTSRRYSKKREEYKDWPLNMAREFKDCKANPGTSILYPLTADGWKFKTQTQGPGEVEGTKNYLVWRIA